MSEAESLIALLRERGLTLGVAESLTGGEVSSALVSIPGASDVLRGGVVAYATPVKQTLLGVDAALLDAHGGVHPEVARQMAEGVRHAVAVAGQAADVGIATTGVAGPDPADGHAVGTVYIGIAVAGATEVHAQLFAGDRAAIRRQTTAAALTAALLAVQNADAGE